MYKYIFFDLDGTLTDPVVGITKSVEYALNKMGIKVENRKELCPFIGPPLTKSFNKYYGFDDETTQKAIEYYREYFSDRGLFENEVYEGIPEVLKELKKNGYILAVATGKPEQFAKQILEKFDLIKYFDFVAGSTMDLSRCEKDDIINYAVENLRINNKEEILMIGDRDNDIFGAKKAGVDCLSVLYGYGSAEEFESAGAQYIEKEVKDILSFIEEHK